MKVFVVLLESPFKIRKIAINHFIIYLLAPELLRFKDLKNDQKWCRVLGKIKTKFINSVTSCHGHMAEVNL